MSWYPANVKLLRLVGDGLVHARDGAYGGWYTLCGINVFASDSERTYHRVHEREPRETTCLQCFVHELRR